MRRMQRLTNPSQSVAFVGKNRNPFAVWFLSAITFGIYFLYWHYKVNSEIGAHEPEVKTSPGVSLLAVSPLAVFTLFISALVSMYNTAVRIQRMEAADDLPNQISPLVTIILLFFFGIGYYFQIQGHLNSHWDRHRLIASGRVPEPLTSPTGERALPEPTDAAGGAAPELPPASQQPS
jgi:heme/copper-type cytochrome/quinol oxidase subunit 3